MQVANDNFGTVAVQIYVGQMREEMTLILVNTVIAWEHSCQAKNVFAGYTGKMFMFAIESNH